MADVGNLKKLTRNPQRLMGTKSADVEGSVLYYELGTFTVADNVTSSTLPTSLTNVKMAFFQPLNAAGVTGAPLCDNTLSSAKLTVATTDPGGTASYSYFLIGSIETA